MSTLIQVVPKCTRRTVDDDDEERPLLGHQAQQEASEDLLPKAEARRAIEEALNALVAGVNLNGGIEREGDLAEVEYGELDQCQHEAGDEFEPYFSI